MSWRIGFATLALLAAACATTPKPTAEAPVHSPAASVEELAAAIKSDADRSEHEPDARTRSDLAAQADQAAQSCLAIAPDSAACQYGDAVSLGLQARGHPTHAGEFLGRMLDALAKAEAADPAYDEAGPARVRALVLIRAPAWPLGPGDADAGLTAARRAVALRPGYPPNLLALAESLARTGDASSSRDYYTRAREAAMTMPAGADRDDWLHAADQGLHNK
ncbi:MAG TPA: hypothetical protein VGL55_07265 [Steroidobacteraceae bacterium]